MRVKLDVDMFWWKWRRKVEWYICEMATRQTFPESWSPAVRSVNGRYRLRVWVSPRASRTEVGGMYGDSVKIRVNAPPERGKANRAVERLLSREVGMAARVIAGHSTRRKEVELTPRHDNL